MHSFEVTNSPFQHIFTEEAFMYLSSTHQLLLQLRQVDCLLDRVRYNLIFMEKSLPKSSERTGYFRRIHVYRYRVTIVIKTLLSYFMSVAIPAAQFAFLDEIKRFSISRQDLQGLFLLFAKRVNHWTCNFLDSTHDSPSNQVSESLLIVLDLMMHFCWFCNSQSLELPNVERMNHYVTSSDEAFEAAIGTFLEQVEDRANRLEWFPSKTVKLNKYCTVNDNSSLILSGLIEQLRKSL